VIFFKKLIAISMTKEEGEKTEVRKLKKKIIMRMRDRMMYLRLFWKKRMNNRMTLYRLMTMISMKKNTCSLEKDRTKRDSLSGVSC